MSIERVAVCDIVPNAYRRIDTYKINESKIEALLSSYDNSGFWDGSIQARPHPNKPGKYEIAFGHHRIEAARRAKMPTVGLVVAARSNADMLRMMADENREEFKGDHLVAIETVGATIEAFGRGEIDLPPVSPDTRKDWIHSVSPRGDTYSCATVARFLGWTRASGPGQAPEATRACRLAFEAYHERDTVKAALQRLPEDDRSRQATTAVLKAVKSARHIAEKADQPKAEVEKAVTRAANAAVKQIASGGMATAVKNEAEKIGRAAARVERSAVDVSDFVLRRASGIESRVLHFRDAVTSLCLEIEPYIGQIEPNAMRRLVEVLQFMREDAAAVAARWLERLEPEVINVTPMRRQLKG